MPLSCLAYLVLDLNDPAASYQAICQYLEAINGIGCTVFSPLRKQVIGRYVARERRRLPTSQCHNEDGNLLGSIRRGRIQDLF